MIAAIPYRNKILIIGFSFLHQDARICRQIGFVKDDYAVTVAGFSDPQIPGICFISLPPLLPSGNWHKISNLLTLKLHRFEQYYQDRFKHYYEYFKDDSYDLIIANDIETLPLAVKIAHNRNTKILFDSHEYPPREFEGSFKWRFAFGAFRMHLCRRYLPQCHAITTVCAAIAQEFSKIFHVHSEVITNADTFWDLEPSPVEPGRIRLVHHGVGVPQRQIETMIEVVRHLPQSCTLDLFLIPGHPLYIEKLKKAVDLCSNIQLHEPIIMAKIPALLNNFDMGIHIIKPDSFNNQFSLPNKFFTFIQARLAIAIGPSPEMAQLVNRYQLGVVAPDFNPETMASLLKNITSDQLKRYKQQAHLAAQELSADANKAKLNSIIRGILKSDANQ